MTDTIVEESHQTSIIELQEKSDDKSEYNVDMSVSQAKRTLETLSKSLINDENKKISQYTANIYANIITKNLLTSWAKSFKNFKIKLDEHTPSSTLEFVTPKIDQAFVARFVNGRETINGFLHKSSTITIKMSPDIFHTMKNPEDGFNFFKAAVQYYDSKIDKVSNKLMAEVMKLGHNMKHLIANSKLSGLVIYPLKLLFVFSDINMSDKDAFIIKEENIQAVNKFIKNISSRYAAPDKEKTQIIDDVRKMLKLLKESCGPSSEVITELSYFPEALENFLFNGFDDLIQTASNEFVKELVESNYTPQLGYRALYEKAKIKKLKKLPSDLIAYVSIEADSIRDNNDRMMLASYVTGKLDIIDWYIQLLETDKGQRYLVPHTKPQLESMRTQLLACYKKVLNIKVVPPHHRPIINIRYPDGYQG